MPELSDEKIMLLVKEGHLSELTELFERYHVLLYNFFLRLTFDKVTSEDLTQNLFYRVIKYRQSYQPANGSFKSWIYRIARNGHADFCQQAPKVPGRPGSRAEEVEGIEEIPGEGFSEADGAANGDGGYSETDFERLDRAMARLSEGQREVLVLSRYQGLKYAEIAKIKEVSVAAIKVQVHRAIRELRALYFGRTGG